MSFHGLTANAAATKPCLLIVDDEPSNVQVLAAALGDGYALRFATDGSRALSLAQTQNIDLILLDVQMPGLNGYQVLAALKADARTQAIPVIFVTGQGEIDDEARGLNAGAVDYIVKPANAAIVRARVATHVELKRQRDLLERLAMIDGLTGVANRRYFDAELARRLQAARSAPAGLALALIDVDHFKAYNDHYGHLAGDDALRAVAACLRPEGDQDGLLARFGGEEFAALLQPSVAEAWAEQALTRVRTLAMPHARSSAADYLSVSLGVLVLPRALELDASELLARADALLYEAKHGGRNQSRILAMD